MFPVGGTWGRKRSGHPENPGRPIGYACGSGGGAEEASGQGGGLTAIHVPHGEGERSSRKAGTGTAGAKGRARERARPPRGDDGSPEGSKAPTRVLIVDDHRLFAEAVIPALKSIGMEVDEPAADAAQALDAIKRQRPDLALVDLGLPDMYGIELGKIILDEWDGIVVVALTELNDPRAVREAIQAGFHGYITKDTPLPLFLRSVQMALAGEVVMPHRLAALAAGARSPQEKHADLIREKLTPREYQVLALLVEGASTKTIARRLSLSTNTVRTHAQNILEKLQVSSRLEAVAFAVRHGLVTGQEGS
jgi:DNA-binding NarL/FixJ family response regulator